MLNCVGDLRHDYVPSNKGSCILSCSPRIREGLGAVPKVARTARGLVRTQAGAPHLGLTGLIRIVNWVRRVNVRIRIPAGYWINREEAARGGVVQADTPKCDTAQSVSAALFRAEPPVSCGRT